MIKKPCLTKIFQEYRKMALQDYASLLYQDLPSINFEEFLSQALQEELAAIDLEPNIITKVLNQLQNTPVLQTSHHITPTNGPRFNTIDLISLAGKPKDDFYLVGACSSIPFSNSAYSGSLSFDDLALDHLILPTSRSYQKITASIQMAQEQGAEYSKINLLPSKYRDALLFGFQWQADVLSVFQDSTPRLQSFLPQPTINQFYSHWAVKVCATIQQHIFKHPKIIYFDLNAVIQRYLIKVFAHEAEHPIKQLFFSSLSNSILAEFNFPHLFIKSKMKKKKHKIELIFLKGQKLVNAENEIIGTIDEIGALLASKSLCPSIFLVFFIIRFLNGIRCFGSFNQVDYLEEYRQHWLKLHLPWNLFLQKDALQTFTSGYFYLPNQQLCWPLTLAIKGEHIELSEYFKYPMSYFWEELIQQLNIED